MTLNPLEQDPPISKERKLAGVRLLITDWSGVISDDRPPVYEANMRIIQSHGIPRVNLETWLEESQASAAEYFTYKGITQDPQLLLETYRQTLTHVKNDGVHPIVYLSIQTQK